LWIDLRGQVSAIPIKNPEYAVGYIERVLGEFEASLEEDFFSSLETIVEDLQSSALSGKK
jgi:hypothetical protein